VTTTTARHRFRLFGGAAIGALLALGAIGPVGAAPLHHHHHQPAVGHRDYGAEIEALKARLDEEAAARAQDEAARAEDLAQIQAARNDAAQARADADAARAQLAGQIQTLPGEVSSAVAAARPKPSWADNTTVGSTVFLDLSNISQAPTPNKINGTGVDIKRAYVSVDHTFNDVFSANLTLDLAPNGLILNGGTYGTGTEQGSALVKYAYVQAKVLGDALVVRGGGSSMPWIPFVENVYGYRFVEKTYTDLNKFANTTDWGAFASGKLADGLVGYSVAVVDGAGFKTPERSKTMDVEGRVNLNWNGFVAAVGGYSGKEGNDIQQLAPATFHTAAREDAFLAYVNPTFRIGVEYLDQQNYKTVTKSTPLGGNDKSEGYSAFGSFNLTPQVSVFGRYDSTKPSQTQAPSEDLTYFNLGVSYEPVKVIDLALVYKHEEVKHAPSGGYADANTTLAPLGGSGHYDEVGVFGQYKF
jgi:hypothetical protein